MSSRRPSRRAPRPKAFPPKPRRKFDEAKVRAIIERVSALPILDSRSADEIIGYNEFGVPE